MHVEADCDLERAADGLPGAELVVPGMRDLREGRISEASLLVSIAAPRIRRLGFHVPDIEDVPWPYERQLYALLERTLGRGAYSRYNSLIRRIVSFSSALEGRKNRNG